MNFKVLLIAILVFLISGPVDQGASPEELLKRSIRHHDPLEQWGTDPLTLHLRETRPGSSGRTTQIHFNFQKGIFTLDQKRDENQLLYHIENGECSFQLNGKKKISEEEREKFRLNCERAKTMQDYYSYLWGLPMKLKDKGTRLQEVKRTTFMGKDAYSLKVTYDPEVGSDTWYFYFEPNNYALIGYRFYHDESAGDGEYISLDSTQIIKGLRIPKVRKWYTNQEDKFLGTDVLMR